MEITISNNSLPVSNDTIKKEIKTFLLEKKISTQDEIISNFSKYSLNQSKVSRILKDIGFEKNEKGYYAETKESTLARNKRIFASICENEQISLRAPLVYAFSDLLLDDSNSKEDDSESSDLSDETSPSSKKKKPPKMYCVPIRTPAGSESYITNVVSNIIEDIEFFGITSGFRCVFILTYSKKRAKSIYDRLRNAKNFK
jgi:arginine repressor